MGAYVNPLDGRTKEQFLQQHGTELYEREPETIWAEKPDDSLPVVLCDNGLFTAAGICFSRAELRAFLSPQDMRPKRVFYVSTEILHTVSRELESYLRYAQVGQNRGEEKVT